MVINAWVDVLMKNTARKKRHLELEECTKRNLL